jgi:hypothetical protein
MDPLDPGLALVALQCFRDDESDTPAAAERIRWAKRLLEKKAAPPGKHFTEIDGIFYPNFWLQAQRDLPSQPKPPVVRHTESVIQWVRRNNAEIAALKEERK